MTATSAPELAMEVLHDAGDYRHLKFTRGPAGWELLTFPGGVMVHCLGHYVFANGAEDIAASFEFTEADPAYWEEKTSSVTRVWDGRLFREWLIDEAQDADEVDDFLDEADLDTEVLAREALAASELDIEITDADAERCYDWDPHYLHALRLAADGLAHYTQHH